MSIPFNKPAFFESSIDSLQLSLRSGNISGRGSYTKKCEDWLKDRGISENVLISTSCTHALEACALLLNLSGDDEIIVPSYTFVTSALAFLLHGANLRFCDIRMDTLNIDERLIEQQITKNTKAIVVVHYAGVACEMDKIMEIAKQNNIAVIEDNAHGLLGKYKGRYLGSIGDLSTASFHETKNISCGEGGALFINNSEYVDRAHIIFEKGTNRMEFINGTADKYRWVDKGSSYILSDLLSALLHSQLVNSSKIQKTRERLWNTYFSSLENWASSKSILLPTVPQYCDQSFHMFYLILPTNESRNRLIKYLGDSDISAPFHYLPLDQSPMGQKIKMKDQIQCPISFKASQQIIRLPLYYDMTEDDQSKVINLILSYEP